MHSSATLTQIVTSKWDAMALCQGIFCFAVVKPFVNKELGKSRVKPMAYIFFFIFNL